MSKIAAPGREPGKPSPATKREVAKLMAEVLGQGQPYQGASTRDASIGSWVPSLRSADAEILRDAAMIRSRARDLIRNNPTARNALRISRLGTIGAHLKLVLRPDHKALGIDHRVAVQWARMAERVWETYSHGIGNWLDAGRRFSFTEQAQLEHDSDFTDGECVVAAEWRPDGSPWQTCFQVVDVDRLSNPYGRPDTVYLRGGVEIDDFGAPTGFHIRHSHPGDIGLIGAQPYHWDLVPRETPWLRPIVMHSFDPQRAGQTRGISEFASVIRALKRGDDYQQAELDNANARAGYVAVLTSAINFEKAAEILGQSGWDPSATDENGNPLSDPLTEMAFRHLQDTIGYYNELNLNVNGQRVPKLSPGDKLEFLGNNTPGPGYAEYIKSQLRNVAAGLGVDPIGLSQDLKDVNYSSARYGGWINGGHTESRRARLIRMVFMPKVAAWMEEAVLSGRLPMPEGMIPSDFYLARDYLVRGTFLCAGRPSLDPQKDAMANQVALGYGGTTLEEIAAVDGVTAEERIEQLARENMMREEHGLMPVGALPMVPPEGEPDGDEASEEAPAEDDAGESEEA